MASKQFQDILVLSDTQVGSIWGLWPSEYAMTDGTQRSQNKGQQYLWKTWLHLSHWLAEAQKRGDAHIVAVVLNGDLIDGKQRLQEALEAMTPNLVDQGRAFRICLDAFLAPLTPRPTLYSVQGTEYHDEKSGTAVESLAEAIGAVPFESVGIGEYSGELLDLNVDGVVLNFLHGISATAGLYRAVAIDREALWSAIAGKEGKVPKADVIVRSHVHHFVHVEHESKHALITPCWQLQTRFMRRVSAYRMMPDIGAVVIRVWKEATFGGDRVSIYKFLYPLPTRKAVPLTLPADASA